MGLTDPEAVEDVPALEVVVEPCGTHDQAA
jgi:hypothetical protein